MSVAMFCPSAWCLYDNDVKLCYTLMVGCGPTCGAVQPVHLRTGKPLASKRTVEERFVKSIRPFAIDSVH